MFITQQNSVDMFEGCELLPGYSSTSAGERDIRYAKPIANGGFFTVRS